MLCELLYPHGSGSELATYLYAELLKKAGINVTIVTNRFTGEPEVSRKNNLMIYRLPLLSKKSVKYSTLRRLDILTSSFMRKLIKQADIVYIPRYWFSAIPLAKALRKPVIVHLHDYISICPLALLYDSRRYGICRKGKFCSAGCIYAYESVKKNLFRTTSSVFLNLTVWRILKCFIECADAIICVSNTHRDLLVKHAPSVSKKIHVIYNPLPSLPFTEINGDGFGYFGGPSYARGFHVLLRALHHRRAKKLKLVNVYATKFINNKHYDADLFDKFRFILYGKLRYRELDEIYRKIKAVIIPSTFAETFSYVAAESLLRGRLIIASNIGGMLELMEGCKGVFLFDTGNAVQLAEKIDYVNGLSISDVFDLCLSNRERFRKRFSNEKTLQKFLDLCNKIAT